MSMQDMAVARKAQKGMTLIGFIFILAFVLFFVYIGIKLIPIYLNHFSVVSEVNAVADQPGSANIPPNTLRRNLVSRLDLSYVEYVEAQDISIERGQDVRLIIDYKVETHLIGNIDAVISFRTERELNNQ